LLQRMLAAEDARGTGAEGIAPLLEGAKSADSTIRRVAVRGLGRLQRPELTPELIAAMNDSLPSVRVEAVNALVQSIQSLPHGKTATDASRAAVSRVRAAFDARQAHEDDLSVVGEIASSAGRVAAETLEDAQWTYGVILHALTSEHGVEWTTGPIIDYRPRTYHFDNVPNEAALQIVRGLYSLYRQDLARTMPLGFNDGYEMRLILQQALTFPDPRVRRLALLALVAARFDGSVPVASLLHDADPQVRRLSLMAAPYPEVPFQAAALADSSPMVRAEAVRSARARTTLCGGFAKIVRDPDPSFVLAAIDAAASCFTENSSLHRIAASRDSTGAIGRADRASWRPAAHAVLAMAHTPPGFAGEDVTAHYATDAVWQVREYAARAAIVRKNEKLTVELAADPNDNVRATAIAGLAQLANHKYDSVYVAALDAAGYPVVLAAAKALAGSRDGRATPALLRALDRMTAARRENSRDERVAMLARLGELGSPSIAPRIEPYLTDFDTTIASNAAAILSKWSGQTVRARAQPLSIRAEPLAQIFRARNLRLRITMADSSGGGTILVRLFTDETPATIARIVRLARAHYYDGLTFHRIVPGFVIQGGSPGANEQVGDAAFMRDELGMRSHDRGTLGISTRGRDTGDAQFFINLVDNPRLDHDYTVFGEVISGMDVVDRVLEGDVMARVEVIGGTIQH